MSKQEPEDDEQRDPSMTDQALTIWKEPWTGDDES